MKLPSFFSKLHDCFPHVKKRRASEVAREIQKQVSSGHLWGGFSGAGAGGTGRKEALSNSFSRGSGKGNLLDRIRDTSASSVIAGVSTVAALVLGGYSLHLSGENSGLKQTMNGLELKNNVLVKTNQEMSGKIPRANERVISIEQIESIIQSTKESIELSKKYSELEKEVTELRQQLPKKKLGKSPKASPKSDGVSQAKPSSLILGLLNRVNQDLPTGSSLTASLKEDGGTRIDYRDDMGGSGYFTFENPENSRFTTEEGLRDWGNKRNIRSFCKKHTADLPESDKKTSYDLCLGGI